MENSSWAVNLKNDCCKYSCQKSFDNYNNALEYYELMKYTQNRCSLIEYVPVVVIEEHFTNEEIIDNFEKNKSILEMFYGEAITMTKEEYKNIINNKEN